MAEAPSPSGKKKRQLKSTSVREKTEQAASKPAKPRRFRRTASTLAKPISAVSKVGKKEVYLPMPDNKAGRLLNKRRHIVPSYFRNAWRELKQVTWPNRKETAKLTTAVVIFAIAFAALIGIVDYGLDKIFKKILL